VTRAKAGNSDPAVGCCVVALVVAWLVVQYALQSPEEKYANKYGVKPEQVTIQKQPHDCEYETAPLGKKNCHYEQVVTTVLVTADIYGKAIVSYDDGKTKTWHFIDPANPVTPSVVVTWNRIED
jgi:hypothetical protein